jgi:uncharacterized protein YndB with AHSA1/START domain
MAADPLSLPRTFDYEARFEASPETVTWAWTEAAALARWWGPEGAEIPEIEAEAVPGGPLNLTLAGPWGSHRMRGRYLTVAPAKSLELETWVEADGSRLFTNHIQVTLQAVPGGCRMQVAVRVFQAQDAAAPFLQGMDQGWQESLERLGDFVPVPARSFQTARIFDFPLEKLFDAYDKPEALRRWMTPKGGSCLKDESDGRGRRLLGFRGPDGSEHWGLQWARERRPPRRLSWVQSFSDAQGRRQAHPSAPDWPLRMLATLDFESLDQGRSRLSVTWSPVNAEPQERAAFESARDALVAGFDAQFDAVTEYLEGEGNAAV